MNGSKNGRIRARRIVEDAWNERDHHGDHRETNDYGKDNLDEAAVLLQNANHA